jgi:hypothetical protein
MDRKNAHKTNSKKVSMASRLGISSKNLTVVSTNQLAIKRLQYGHISISELGG